MTATRTTVKVSRETAELALFSVDKSKSDSFVRAFLTHEEISERDAKHDAAIADLRRALAEGDAESDERKRGTR